jgi:hypothetical protein
MQSSRHRTSWWLATEPTARLFLLVLGATLVPCVAPAPDPLRVYAAGSLRTPSWLPEIASRRSTRYRFGSSRGLGLLRERLVPGEAADAFGSSSERVRGAHTPKPRRGVCPRE